ncbi:electron transport complex subunit E [Agitococcus lubricus]|uniref:Ion-translocating oxidoreductase complex subunit E n=1 Tax=Agitococcus lubricus TaxID=1077255 RepID=A0A2T5IVG2_9GAMM|nr:electron transport complex subunit E [Agitococcus lubricus]PTQ87866.1 electron transport complex protein RnfE [Agitococcus lubricus]
MTSIYKTIAIDGLWRNNTATVQLLGLCPLLACSGSVVNGLSLGLATTLALVTSNAAVSAVRHWVPNTLRIPIFVMIIAAFVSCIELLIHAFSYSLYQALGIFIPLIVTNCALLGRAEAFASKNNTLAAAFDGLMVGLGFTLVLVLLGAMREGLGYGTLFANMHLLFGEYARTWTLRLADYKPFLFFVLPPGAFLCLGLVIAAKNSIDEQLKRKKQHTKHGQTGSKRVRTTGHIS